MDSTIAFSYIQLKTKNGFNGRFLAHYLPQCLQTLASFFSHNNLTPVRLQDGHVPLQPSALMFLPRLALAMNQFPQSPVL